MPTGILNILITDKPISTNQYTIFKIFETIHPTDDTKICSTFLCIIKLLKQMGLNRKDFYYLLSSLQRRLRTRCILQYKIGFMALFQFETCNHFVHPVYLIELGLDTENRFTNLYIYSDGHFINLLFLIM